MKVRLKLRRDSIGNQVLVRLSNAPLGQLPASAFFDLLKGKFSASHDARLASLCDRILQARMVTIDGTTWTLTLRGRMQLFGQESVASANPVAVTPSRTMPPFRPLRLSPPRQHYRRGSSDYTLIPSLYARMRRLPSGEVVE